MFDDVGLEVDLARWVWLRVCAGVVLRGLDTLDLLEPPAFFQPSSIVDLCVGVRLPWLLLLVDIINWLTISYAVCRVPPHDSCIYIHTPHDWFQLIS